jgi:hypothetical protein
LEREMARASCSSCQIRQVVTDVDVDVDVDVGTDVGADGELLLLPFLQAIKGNYSE